MNHGCLTLRAHAVLPQCPATRAFSLLELMVAVLLSGLIVVMIAGTLRSSIHAWEAAQTKIAENYNRRTVLDLIKRQASSIFYRQDADELMRQNPNPRAETRDRRLQRNRRQENQRYNTNRRQEEEDRKNNPITLELPEGAAYFEGTEQELRFLSTVSFLSDFPGQAAVRYFVIQQEGDLDEGLTVEDLSVQELDLEEGELLEGRLYLCMEEQNLFVSNTMDESVVDFEGGLKGMDGEELLEEEQTEEEETLDIGESDSFGQIQGTNRMVLLGPLRSFSIAYRRPATRGAEEDDTEEDWAESWSQSAQGYPTAIEFIFFYEEPGVTDDIPTEELPGIRMVIPVYDSKNLARGGSFAPF